MLGSNGRKRQRFGSSPRFSTQANIESCRTDGTLTEITQKPLGFSKTSTTTATTVFGYKFNDPATSDVILRLHLECASDQLGDLDFDLDPDSISSADSANQADVKLYLHSDILRRSQYFSALLSDRWQSQREDSSGEEDGEEHLEKVFNHVLKVPASMGSIDSHLTVLQLLYTDDFFGTIDSASAALCVLPVALELLFEDCVRACVRFLEAVPWTEEEENQVLSIIPLLTEEESRELVARVLPSDSDLSEEMLYSLILSAIHNHPNTAFPKAFVAKLLRDFSSRDSARRVLDRAFGTSLNLVKEAMEAYSSPDFRGEFYETEAMQRVNLHKAMANGRQLLWLIERMIDLRVADTAVKVWSDQSSFTANLMWAFRDDAWKNIVQGLPAVVLRCTSRLANAVSTGSILASRQVRMKLVKDWLPVLIVCRGKMLATLHSHQTLYQELEETFLKIISTLPMSDAQELLPQCLNFSTRNVEDCPHLVSAFNTWFRRAARTPLSNDNPN